MINILRKYKQKYRSTYTLEIKSKQYGSGVREYKWGTAGETNTMIDRLTILTRDMTKLFHLNKK